MRVLRAVSGLALGGLAIVATLYTLDRAFPPNLSRVESIGTEILDRNNRLLAVLPAPGGVWRLRTTTDDVSRPFLDLLIHTEDRRFWSHPGVDPIAAIRATAQMLRAGHVVSGGSTLAMQAARLLEPRPRTLRSKLIESARALQLEWRYGKQGVLGIWLTLAPYGGNLEGVRAGARAWFGTTAAALDPAQAALLVALPRRPEALRPDRHPARAERLRDRVLAEAEGVPVPTQRKPFPRHAAQALQNLPLPLGEGRGEGPSRREHQASPPTLLLPREEAPLPSSAATRPPTIRTTLDLPLQTALERLATDKLAAMPERMSLSILVADAATREIRALVSGRWAPDARVDESRAGALDLTRAIRSPGSALKPFLYAQAFQDGIARPDTPLADLPRHFGAYAPENYLRGHAGTVSAADALRRSLNLPAVALLDQVGPLRFAETLRAGGAKPRTPHNSDAALPLALGGAGLTMREMVGLYAGLASPGGAGPLTLHPNTPRPTAPQTEAQRLVADILTQPFPDGGPPGIGWKTGTSWGGRDAWAFGFDTRHVVGVWVGRPDGTPVPGATGRALALPLLAQVFGLLPAAPREPASPVRMATAQGETSLRLLFPPPEAVLSGDGPVMLRAMGGRRPLTFLVDGAPVPGRPASREAGWQPGGPGFYTITVLDADGTAARAPVRGPMKTTQTPTLEIAYLESGPADGPPVILLHGFPYDVHAYDDVAPPLAAAGCRVIVPYLRGYGPTRFLDPATPRSGQQAAFGVDLRDLMDALQIPQAILAGYDWGGRGACIVAALWPERVRGLVTIGGYNIQDIAVSTRPGTPEQEHRYWYQYYLHTPRGEAGWTQDRNGFARILWRLWSPTWAFDDATFARSAESFRNPDFVPVVVQSYRHRFTYAPGDPALEPIEHALAAQPPITVPTIVLHGADDGVALEESSEPLTRFTGPVRREVVPGAGHNLPQEKPEPVIRAILELLHPG